MSTAKILIATFLAAASCSAVGVGDSMRAVEITREPAAAPPTGGPSPTSGPFLCDFPANHCVACGGPALPPCPANGSSGPLCCVGDICVVWSGSHCSGDLGWCFNYTKTTDPSGVVVATCHDDQEGD